MKKVIKKIFFNLMFNILKITWASQWLSFLLERMKIEKVEKLFANLHDKNEYIFYRRNLKQALNDGLVLKNIHRVIKFNEKAWL